MLEEHKMTEKHYFKENTNTIYVEIGTYFKTKEHKGSSSFNITKGVRHNNENYVEVIEKTISMNHCSNVHQACLDTLNYIIKLIQKTFRHDTIHEIIITHNRSNFKHYVNHIKQAVQLASLTTQDNHLLFIQKYFEDNTRPELKYKQLMSQIAKCIIDMNNEIKITNKYDKDIKENQQTTAKLHLIKQQIYEKEGIIENNNVIQIEEATTSQLREENKADTQSQLSEEDIADAQSLLDELRRSR